MSETSTVDYDLTRLGTREFEHLCQSLFTKTAGVQCSIFGDGADGGREATYDGSSSLGKGVTPWNGYHVLQAKFRARPLGTPLDQQWFLSQVASEIADWGKPGARRNQRRRPEYLLLATNVTLSAAAGGGIDQINDLLQSHATHLGLHDWIIWHRDSIRVQLDDSRDIRQAYAGLLTPGDILATISTMLEGQSSDLSRVLSEHAAKDLVQDQFVRLSQAGGSAVDKPTLDQIAIDLPLEVVEGDIDGDRGKAAKRLIEHGDQVLKSSVFETGPRHLVLVGGAGQGKTTISQLVTQAYRTALLSNGRPASRQVGSITASMKTALTGQNIPNPNNVRWPIRLDLGTFADHPSSLTRSLIRWIADEISMRGSETIQPSALRAWLINWPSVIVLDGLDEVASPLAKEVLVGQVEEFIVEMDNDDSDVFMIVTTRPQGLANAFVGPDFDHIQLRELRIPEAVVYATKLADLRHSDDQHLHAQTLKRIRQAATERVTARLMRTPLQITIMYLLLERASRPPQYRHSLFEAYFDTIYSREVSKPGPLAKFLDDFKSDIVAIHEQVGLEIQALDPQGAGTISRERLHALAVKRLGPQGEGHEPTRAIELANMVVKSATERLVLLTPSGSLDIGFEIRSLREYMAARALTNAQDDVTVGNLSRIAPFFHWRNTYLLAAGRIFAAKQNLRAGVLSGLREIDGDYPFLAIGAEVALQMLSDDIVTRAPNFERQLLLHSLELLDHPPTGGEPLLANVLVELYERPELKPQITSALTQGAATSMSARLVLKSLSSTIGPLSAKARQLIASHPLDQQRAFAFNAWNMSRTHKYNLQIVRTDSPLSGSVQRRLGWPLKVALTGLRLKGETKQIVDDFINQLNKTTLLALSPEYTVYVLNGAAPYISRSKILEHRESRLAIELALADLDLSAWTAEALVVGALRNVFQAQVASLQGLIDQT